MTLLRNLLVSDTGVRDDLLAGVSPAWMRPGQTISVHGAPTAHGTISFTERATRDGATLRWRGRATPDWTLPYWVRHARTGDGRAVGHVVALPGPSGSLTLHWSATAPALSQAGTVAALDRGYRAHRRAAPIRPAPDW